MPLRRKGMSKPMRPNLSPLRGGNPLGDREKGRAAKQKDIRRRAELLAITACIGARALG